VCALCDVCCAYIVCVMSVCVVHVACVICVFVCVMDGGSVWHSPCPLRNCTLSLSDRAAFGLVEARV
jgi:hypothetical protein